MPIKTGVLAACIVLIGSISLARGPAKPDPKDIQAVVQGANDFAVDLYVRLSAEKPGNLFFSPASIGTALAMTYSGAAGETAKEMARTLHYPLAADKLGPVYSALINTWNHPTESGRSQDKRAAFELIVANRLWGGKNFGFKTGFLALVKQNYGASVGELDFTKTDKSCRIINDWVAQQTKDKIKNLITKEALNERTRLVLTNAIYFKSSWAAKFDEADTRDVPFKLTSRMSVDVPMMIQQENFGYMENDDLQLLELSFNGYALSMVVLLPKPGREADAQKSLTSASLDQWLKALKPSLVKVTLPKFKFSGEFMLADTLKAMGMADAFTNGADFSGMTEKEQLFISQVIHKAFVDVDENGTEAAAATAVTMVAPTAALVRPNPKVFNADHPFVFLIRHNSTGQILFMGRLANPKG